MAQKESTFINMVATLFLVTLVSAGALGFVHGLTTESIATAKTNAQNDAILRVLPGIGEVGRPVSVLPEGSSDSVIIYPAYKEGTLIGYAVKSSTESGFSGHISVMAGLDTLGNFTGYEVLEHKETPGLGSKMTDWFRNSEKQGQNVIGKNPGTSRFEVRKDGGDIDAITASTITSRAFLEALRKAWQGTQTYEQNLPGPEKPGEPKTIQP